MMRALDRLADRAPGALALVVALLVFASLLVPETCAGQRWDVWRVSVDQIGPWEVRGPRIGFTALRAGASVESYRVLRAAHVPPWSATLAGAVTIGALPHAVGLARHAYPFDGPDVAGDLVVAWAAAVAARRCDRRVRSSRCAKATALALAIGAVAMGFTHP